MANEIRMTYDPNETLYAVIFNAAGQVWQTTTTSFVTYDDDSQANYDIALTEAGDDSGEYRGTFPADISAGVYSVQGWAQAGGSPDQDDDERLGGVGTMHWDGSAELAISADSQMERNLGLSASYDGTTVKLGLWLEESGQRQTDVTSITDVEIWNAATDAQVVDLGDDTADSADGVFYFSGAASLAYNTPYYVKATLNEGGSAYAMQAGLVRI